MIGAPLGAQYRVVERLGEGGMGVVYVVEHLTLKKRFAAKVLSAQLASSAEARARFEAEAHAASKLEHENVVNVHDYGLTTDGRPYLVMELLKGQTLFERLQEGPMTMDDVVAVIVQMCEGLEAAHSEGFVHRDVKPENIFLVQRSGGRFQVKLLDFGITKLRAGVGPSRITQLGQVLGSPFYMAPEACKGLEIDHRADIYSVGIVLYQMVCGVPPFTDENHLRVLNRHMYDAPPPPRSLAPQVPPALEAVILKTLAKEPRDRYQTIGDLADDLSEALPDEALRARRQRTPLGMPRAGTPIPSGNYTPVSSGQFGPVDPVGATARVEAARLDEPSTTLKTRRGRPAWILPAVVLGVAAVGVAVWQLTRSRGSTTVPGPVAATPGPGSGDQPTAPTAPTAPIAPSPTPASVEPTKPATPTTYQASVKSTPPGARVSLDGQVVGRTPLELPLPPGNGEVTLEITKKGFEDETRTVRRDRDADLDVTLTAVRETTREHAKPVEAPKPPQKPAERPLEIRRTR